MNFAKNMAIIGTLCLLCVSGLGCDNASETANKEKDAIKKAIEKSEEKIKEGAEAAKQWTKESIAKAKEEYAKHSGTHFEEIELKIKDLTGDAQAEAQALYDKLKEKAQEVKDAAPEKFEKMKAECSDLISDLKKKLGL